MSIKLKFINKGSGKALEATLPLSLDDPKTKENVFCAIELTVAVMDDMFCAALGDLDVFLIKENGEEIPLNSLYKTTNYLEVWDAE
ncbi:hypothetical protein A3715_10340 [Oleiphilus sp. HI0009]|nr:hypothetical protein A3715_10340 [Oleiphilus sp. HI0009]